MRDEPRPDPKTLEAIEARRPYSDDLSDPEVARAAAELADNSELEAFADRLERADARIAAAFHDIPVPAGLAERICQTLSDASASQPAPTPAASETISPQPVAAAVSSGTQVSRRWLLVGTAGIVSAAVMLTAALLHIGHPDSDQPPLLEMAIQFFESDAEAAARGKSIADLEPSRDYPLSPYVVHGQWVRRRNVSGFLGRRGVAYDLTRPGGPRATLYAVKYPLTGLPSAPSLSPTLATHDRSTVAWQTSSVLYVLVVDGGPGVYRAYLNLPTGPLT